MTGPTVDTPKKKKPVIPENLQGWVFLGLLLIGIISVLVVRSMAAGEDAVNIESMQNYQAAKTCCDTGQYTEALQYLAMLPEGYTDSFSALNVKGNADFGLGNYADAVSDYEAAKAANYYLVENQAYLYNYGRVLMETGKYAKAEQCFVKCVQLNTNEDTTNLAKKAMTEIAEKTGDAEHE